MKKPVKKTWAEIQSEQALKKFNDSAKELVWQLTEGGGAGNIHVLETIRQLEYSYLVCAAYRTVNKTEKEGV